MRRHFFSHAVSPEKIRSVSAIVSVPPTGIPASKLSLKSNTLELRTIKNVPARRKPFFQSRCFRENRGSSRRVFSLNKDYEKCVK